MGNSNLAQRARMEADSFCSKWSANKDFEWGYGRDRGPDNWWAYYPAAAGDCQSPIDINPDDAVIDPELSAYPLEINYPVAEGGKVIRNTGHTCQVDVQYSDSSRPFYITGGPLKHHRYELKNFQFHWGERDDCGSEHTIEGQSFSMEIHFVHWNVDLFSSYEEALKTENGVAIMAIFAKALDYWTWDPKVEQSEGNPALNYVASFLLNIAYKGQSDGLSSDFDIRGLLPRDLTKYWVYQGSLTSPPCYESVQWIVFYEPIVVSSCDLRCFRDLRTHQATEVRPYDEFGSLMPMNCRPIQRRHGRKITTIDANYTPSTDLQEQFRDQTLFTSCADFAYYRTGVK